MTTIEPLCNSDYYADLGQSRDRGARLIHCGLPVGHDGDLHDEMIDGEPGIVTWLRRPRQPRVFAPVVIPADVTQVRTQAGVVWERMPTSIGLWQRPDQTPVGRGWVTTAALLTGGPVTEVVDDV